jgi:hypothetical protein
MAYGWDIRHEGHIIDCTLFSVYLFAEDILATSWSGCFGFGGVIRW